MNFQLIPAQDEHQGIISNLMQFYIYDFSEYVDCDVEEKGSFATYPGLDNYWLEKNKFPYLITKDEKYIGFVLVKFVESIRQGYFSIAEFFIMKKYRRQGIGKSAAQKIFNLHQGKWEVYQRENNVPARAFWFQVIREYTSGEFTERFENGRTIQDFENKNRL